MVGVLPACSSSSQLTAQSTTEAATTDAQASCIQYCFSIGNFSFPKANTSTWLLLVVKESLTSIGVHLKF